jgi:hypothetical protein
MATDARALDGAPTVSDGRSRDLRLHGTTAQQRVDKSTWSRKGRPPQIRPVTSARPGRGRSRSLDQDGQVPLERPVSASGGARQGRVVQALDGRQVRRRDLVAVAVCADLPGRPELRLVGQGRAHRSSRLGLRPVAVRSREGSPGRRRPRPVVARRSGCRRDHAGTGCRCVSRTLLIPSMAASKGRRRTVVSPSSSPSTYTGFRDGHSRMSRPFRHMSEAPVRRRGRAPSRFLRRVQLG